MGIKNLASLFLIPLRGTVPPSTVQAYAIHKLKGFNINLLLNHGVRTYDMIHSTFHGQK